MLVHVSNQVSILKENIQKADAEIAELDKLIDMAREVSETKHYL